ncbi:ATP-dependent Clp protease proteolytic subunit [Striga asiatica]|uniref:ATP-dependent Clp protease proteolytic subunit n=1 Tax=Striga asiatica TaxID=4170 RepID=A0A5A7QFK3_STRAF|nr:ATP-dependent Clp protease proteolytic subunit [Striga asiatica]
MANCLRMTTAPSVSCFSSSSLSSPKRRNFCVINCSKLPPINPRDPFQSKLDSGLVEATAEYLNQLGYVLKDLVERSDSYSDSYSGSYSDDDRDPRPESPPPDLESMILDDRIIFLGMPLVSAVTELIVAQFLYLQYDSEAPIQLFINSSGTARADGEVVGLEHEGFAIYDTMMQIKNEIQTLNLALAMGHSCLFLAAGTKGKRFSLPYSKACIQQPRALPSGLAPSSDVLVHAREAKINTDNFIRVFAGHTGNSEETVANAIAKGPYYMDTEKAIEFGVIDKLYYGSPKKKAKPTRKTIVMGSGATRALAIQEHIRKQNNQGEEDN